MMSARAAYDLKSSPESEEHIKLDDDYNTFQITPAKNTTWKSPKIVDLFQPKKSNLEAIFSSDCLMSPDSGGIDSEGRPKTSQGNEILSNSSQLIDDDAEDSFAVSNYNNSLSSQQQSLKFLDDGRDFQDQISHLMSTLDQPCHSEQYPIDIDFLDDSNNNYQEASNIDDAAFSVPANKSNILDDVAAAIENDCSDDIENFNLKDAQWHMRDVDINENIKKYEEHHFKSTNSNGTQKYDQPPHSNLNFHAQNKKPVIPQPALQITDCLGNFLPIIPTCNLEKLDVSNSKIKTFQCKYMS